jgi:thiamine kinase-like enzyme
MDDGSLFPAADESQGLLKNFGRIVEKLSPSLGPIDGEPLPLEGGITNRNYRVKLGDGDYVVRVPGKDTSLLGIDREAERAANELAAELDIAPRVAAFLVDPPCIVTEFVTGSAMDERALRSEGPLEVVAAMLRRLHESGRELPSRFDSFAVVDAYARTATGRGAQLPDAFASARERAAGLQAALDGPEHDPVPCHNDLLAANFIRTDEGIVIVDWEYAGMGDRYFDLANFAINNGLGEGDQARLLDAYWGDPPEEALVDLRRMMVMSDFREAMWGVVQSTVSDLDFDFDAYATKHFERMAAAPDTGAAG